MPFGRILVPVSDERLLERKLDHALAIATRLGARIDVIFLYATVDISTVDSNPFYGSASFEMSEVRSQGEVSAEEHVKSQLRDWAASRKLSGQERGAGGDPSYQLIISHNEYPEILEKHCRTSDLVVIRQPSVGISALDADINTLSLLKGGRPVLVIPCVDIG